MYKESIRRRTSNSHPQIFIPRSDIAFDKRVDYIESVCAVLIESRFIDDPITTVFEKLSDRPEPRAAVFSDLFDSVPGLQRPFYARFSLGRAANQAVEAAFRKAKEMGFAAAASHGNSFAADCPQNLGRSSP